MEHLELPLIKERAPIIIHAGSAASEKHPDTNEDAMFSCPEKGIFGVFDGVGGRAEGNKASKIARDTVNEKLQELSEGITLQQARDAIFLALMKADNAVSNEGKKKKNDKATTASIGLILKGAEKGSKIAIIGNVGDSRVYLLRESLLGEKELKQLTLDDRPVYAYSSDESGAHQLQAEFNNVIDPKKLGPNEQVWLSNRIGITQALGWGEVVPKITTIYILPGDKLLVCTDGISDNLTDTEIQEILNTNPNSDMAVEKLIEDSQKRSRDELHPRAKPDDMTALIIEF